MIEVLLKKLQEKHGDEFNWGVVEDDNYLLDELSSELTSDHPLYGKARKALARCYSQDDVLFLLNDNSYANVHLTYSKNNIGGCPSHIVFPDLQSAIDNIEEEYLEERNLVEEYLREIKQ